MSSAPPPWLRDIRVLSLDVDGTLYPLDWRLRLRALFTPGAARPLRLLKAAREPLRERAFPTGDALRTEVDAALSTLAHITPPEAARLRQHVDGVVMPALLKGRLPTPVRAALESARNAGFTLVAFSDHATGPKVHALGVDPLFLAVVGAEDVGAYKPHGVGFLEVARRAGAEPRQVLHVGDRADTDGVGALAAGMRAAVLAPQVAPAGAWSVAGLPEVVAALVAARRPQV